jgi:hypothetical protein
MIANSRKKSQHQPSGKETFQRSSRKYIYYITENILSAILRVLIQGHI